MKNVAGIGMTYQNGLILTGLRGNQIITIILKVKIALKCGALKIGMIFTVNSSLILFVKKEIFEMFPINEKLV